MTSNTPHNAASTPPPEEHSLGLAGKMTQTFIHSPLSPLLLVASLALGILGLLFTPRQEDPQISVPMVDVFFSYAGASSQQVASLAIDPLERLMSEIPGVEHVYSAAQRGGGMVTVQFTVGEKMEPSLVKLYDKLMSNMDRIPPGVSQPLVKPKGVDDVPVVTLTLWSHEVSDAALRTVALDVLQRLKEAPDTAQSIITGGRAEQIRIEVFPERLKGFGVSVGQLANTIKTANSERDTGYVESQGNSFAMYTGSFLRTPEDVERLVVGVHSGSPVYVRDVALVSAVPEEAKTLVQYFTGPAYDDAIGGDVKAPQGAPAVTISVAKKQGSNGVSVAEDVLKQVEYLKGRVIPDNIEVSVTRNYGETANEKVNELIFKLFVATGAVTLLIWASLGLRAAIVVLLVIPVVILVTVFTAWLLGFTIDRVSLFALIFSIGILVDDAIVVIENIYRRWLEHGSVDTEVSIDAVREVGNPTILATFTVIAALLPMGFVSGMMGPYMAPIPVLGSVAMLLSLFAAFIFTPWLAQRIRPSMKQLARMQDKEHAQAAKLEGVFNKVLCPLIDDKAKNRIFRLSMYAILFLCFALFYTKDVTVKMLPLDNKPEFNVVVNMPDGTALPTTANVTNALTEKLLELPEVTAVQTYAGTASPFNFNGLVRHSYLRDKPWQSDIQIQLLHKSKRDRSSHDLAVAARDMLTPIAQGLGARIQVVEMPPGPPVLQTMVAEIYGPDADTRRQVARDLTKIFEQAPSVVDVDNLMLSPYDVWHFNVDREKAVRLGISVEDINTQIEMVMGGYKLGDVKIERALEPHYIVIQVPLALRSQFGRMGQLPIPAADGSMIPLSELGLFEKRQQDPIIFHKDLRPVEFVTGEVAGRLAAPIYGMFEVEDLLENYTSPDGVKLEGTYLGAPEGSFKSAFEWTGEWTVTYETFRDMGLAFGAALVLIYMLVVWEFGNFKLAGIIMAPLPLTLIGIIPGHWLLNAEFTATSMIGFIALAGIIVRNSILLADFSKEAVSKGMPVREAVLLACRTRTRPIMITAFALLLGSSVILSDPIFQGMAISLMFGGMVSTLLTLVVIPLSCVKEADKAFAMLAPMGGVATVAVAGGMGTADAPTEKRRSNVTPTRVIRAIGFMLWMALVSVMENVQRIKRNMLEARDRRRAKKATTAKAPAKAQAPAPAPKKAAKAAAKPTKKTAKKTAPAKTENKTEDTADDKAAFTSAAKAVTKAAPKPKPKAKPKPESKPKAKPTPKPKPKAAAKPKAAPAKPAAKKSVTPKATGATEKSAKVDAPKTQAPIAKTETPKTETPKTKETKTAPKPRKAKGRARRGIRLKD